MIYWCLPGTAKCGPRGHSWPLRYFRRPLESFCMYTITHACASPRPRPLHGWLTRLGTVGQTSVCVRVRSCLWTLSSVVNSRPVTAPQKVVSSVVAARCPVHLCLDQESNVKDKVIVSVTGIRFGVTFL